MRIWKCDMCGVVIENGEDVMEIVCKEGSEKTSYPNSYEVCRECAKKVDKFIRGEDKRCVTCMYFDYDDHGPKCKLHKEYLPCPGTEHGCKEYRW